MVVYQLPNTFLSLSRVFHAFEEVRKHMPIEDYSVSQTTLDQVFIGFASQQAGDEGETEAEEQASLSRRSSSTPTANVVSNPRASLPGNGPSVRYTINGDVTFDGTNEELSVDL